MERRLKLKASSANNTNTCEAPTSLHATHTLSGTNLNRVVGVIYGLAIISLLYYHALSLLHPTTVANLFISLSLLLSDLVLSFMWATTQSCRVHPVYHNEFPENLEKFVEKSDFPAVDVFICTADPYKEPPLGVVNTALSVMAYEYPADKISVYVSDDRGSQLTLFAFMEATKFASHWLPFCRSNNVIERSPDAYFSSNHSSSETDKIKVLIMH
ncbi:Cellulose synthase-like protein [Quillaja saponaria]|uniref:Cellulose synthase-like protein n=1 Tax=Quillaja saponaria TaxID=32244 RepID=A0AAD7KS86_QUISA|nr:Cellulose synthase-like protein [Quillaja saponaria]